MIIKLVDRKTGKVVVKKSMSDSEYANLNLKDLLADEHLTVDECGNVKTFLGEFKGYVVENLRLVAYGDAS